MKVLFVNGSPRKGNTYKILREINEKLTKMGHITEIISICDFDIKSCTGCFRCVLDGEECCPLADDVKAIWQKFNEANGIVLGVPVYALGIPGLFKNFMDRIAYNAHRPAFYNKPTAIVSTTAGMGTKSAIDQLKWFKLAGCNIVASKGFLTYPKRMDKAKTRSKKDKAIERLISRLDNELAHNKTRRPTLLQVIQFYAVKLNSSFGKGVYKADFEYYKDRDYHLDIKPGKVKVLFAKLFYRIGLKILESAIDKDQAA
jgi:multimeric flavodoxin WrbA